MLHIHTKHDNTQYKQNFKIIIQSKPNIHMSQQIMGVVLTKSWKIFISGKWGWNGVPPTGCLKAKNFL